MAYKHDYDKTLTRLTILLSRMNDGEAISVKEMANELGVSTRTIQRDLNERLTSFPIYKDGQKWKMANGFKLEKITSVENAIVLDIINKMTEGIGVKFHSKAKTLLSKLKNEDFNPIYTKLNIEDITDNLTEIQLLESAIKAKRLIDCIYSFEKYKQDITIKPLKIVNFEGFWYLIALDGRNDILKKYYLKGVDSIKIKEESFEVSSKLNTLLDNSISVWFNDKNEPFEVKINISKTVSKYFKRRPISKNQVVESVYKDGSMDVVIRITSEMEILPIVKYWIPYLRVLEPLWIQEKVDKDLKKYLNLIK